MSRSLVFAALGIVSIFALADDSEPVKKPYVEPGDCWSYRADNMNYNGPIEDYELCVTFVDVVKDVILAVIAKIGAGGLRCIRSMFSPASLASTISRRATSAVSGYAMVLA